MSDYRTRGIEAAVVQDLARKMVFIGGPRQAGKTSMAKHLCVAAHGSTEGRYLTWDTAVHREAILRERFPVDSGMLVLDEVHKYTRWRQVVKGLFDTRGPGLRILVTGSARLDYYRRGGDSLQGRYHFYRLLPFSLAELGGESHQVLTDLLAYGPFPEPFLSGSERQARRWSSEYRTRVIRDDLRDLEQVADVALVEHLVLRLPDLVGSPLSVNALREDLQVSHHTVSRWLSILERLYVIFRIAPFGAPRIRAVKKEAKHYHMDWTLVQDTGARFENLVAFHLLKWCCFQQDTEGRDVELRYFRDIDKREVDFVLTERGTPLHLIECKLASRDLSPSLRYLHERFPKAQAAQVSLESSPDVLTKEGIRMCPAEKLLAQFV